MTSAALRLQHVRGTMSAEARQGARKVDDVCLIAVTKTRSVDEIEQLIAAGQRDFGESRVQEAMEKWPDILARCPNIRLHCIGRLQSNKADDAVRLFDVIHSVDRTSLLDALVRAADRERRFPHTYVQVNIGEEEQKGGCALSQVPQLVTAVRSSPLTLAGLMAIPPLGVEPAPYFALLAKIARRHDVEGLSMGMSSDYPAAIKLGATAVRIGSALFEG